MDLSLSSQISLSSLPPSSDDNLRLYPDTVPIRIPLNQNDQYTWDHRRAKLVVALGRDIQETLWTEIRTARAPTLRRCHPETYGNVCNRGTPLTTPLKPTHAQGRILMHSDTTTTTEATHSPVLARSTTDISSGSITETSTGDGAPSKSAGNSRKRRVPQDQRAQSVVPIYLKSDDHDASPGRTKQTSATTKMADGTFMSFLRTIVGNNAKSIRQTLGATSSAFQMTLPRPSPRRMATIVSPGWWSDTDRLIARHIQKEMVPKEGQSTGKSAATSKQINAANSKLMASPITQRPTAPHCPCGRRGQGKLEQ